MHIHILGICGTFMGSLAVLAKQLGHRVTGSDLNVYPPMSSQLQEQGIELTVGYGLEQLEPMPDCVIIGNVMSRGNPVVEAVLNRNIPYFSGPQWLSDNLLKQKWVVAVAGTHGKTTTSSMVAWILEYAGLSPGFLIGGLPKNFDISARLGQSDFFVIEADEYDTAFFDKRSKFVHYHPKTTVLNNLEFDHADIFSDLAGIQTQFHHLIRIVPEIGCIIRPADDANLEQVIEQGCWTPQWQYTLNEDADAFKPAWRAEKTSADGSSFSVYFCAGNAEPTLQGGVNWSLQGDHNVSNAMSALLAAHHCGVSIEHGISALNQFESVKRRMDKVGEVHGIKIYDDFAHHPTAIASTLAGAKQQMLNSNQQGRLIAVIEPRSNTMKMGVHRSDLLQATSSADQVLWSQPGGLQWDLQEQLSDATNEHCFFSTTEAIVDQLSTQAKVGDVIVVMSNGGFENIHQRILAACE